jgi:hypothetical protein
MRPTAIASYVSIIFNVPCVFLFPSTSNSYFIPLSKKSYQCHSYFQLAAVKKGFGNTKTTQPAKPPKKTIDVNKSSSTVSSDGTTKGVKQQEEEEEDVTATAADYKLTATKSALPDISKGKLALERMRREKAEQRQQELEKIRQVQTMDQMVRESPEAAVIPEKVAQRMGKRMLPFVGIPLLGSMTSIVGFWYMATYRDVEFQPVLVATTSLVLLAIGIVVSSSSCVVLVVS